MVCDAAKLKQWGIEMHNIKKSNVTLQSTYMFIREDLFFANCEICSSRIQSLRKRKPNYVRNRIHALLFIGEVKSTIRFGILAVCIIRSLEGVIVKVAACLT